MCTSDGKLAGNIAADRVSLRLLLQILFEYRVVASHESPNDGHTRASTEGKDMIQAPEDSTLTAPTLQITVLIHA